MSILRHYSLPATAQALAEIRRLNPALDNPSRIFPGQIILLPATATRSP
jgi:hypothetical protein